MTYKMNQEAKMEDALLELTMGHLSCHWCFENICNRAKYVYAKDHICGIPWTYRKHAVCENCFKTYIYAGVPPCGEVNIIGEKL